jgi:uncharacterized membrane protein
LAPLHRARDVLRARALRRASRPRRGPALSQAQQAGYDDFIYFALTIGTSTAVSGVAVTSRTIRKIVTIAADTILLN